MRILIFGAAGGTGRQLVDQALERAHQVTVFVRNPAKLTLRHALLGVVQGDVQRAETIRAAVPGHDAVLSALGTRSLRPTTLLSTAAQAIVRTMQAHDVRRLLWESALGVGETKGQRWAAGLRRTPLPPDLPRRCLHARGVEQTDLRETERRDLLLIARG